MHCVPSGRERELHVKCSFCIPAAHVRRQCLTAEWCLPIASCLATETATSHRRANPYELQESQPITAATKNELSIANVRSRVQLLRHLPAIPCNSGYPLLLAPH